MLQDKNKSQTRTPSGGMNQDDSLITPSKDMAGKNAFEVGDYRYALNARIGSSRGDSFGDLENIKGTVEVTDYNVYGSLVTNPEFTATISPWLQISVGNTWSAISNSARASTGSAGTWTSNILYQPISPTLNKINVSYNCFTSVNATTELRLVFLNGTSVISYIVLDTIITTSDVQVKTASYDLPSGCNGAGFQVVQTTTAAASFIMQYFRVNGFMTGSRPAGTEKVIGKYEDKEFLKLYYAVYNLAGNHCIRYYDKVTDSVFELLKWSGLSFGINYFVKFAKLDNWIAFTDRNNSPRLIDADSVSELYITLGSEFREFHISFHKWAPVMPPVIKKYYDGVTDNYVKFRKKVIQFAYRYIYKGYLRSRWSPSSVGAEDFSALISSGGSGGSRITSIEVYAPGFILDNPEAAVQYNYFGHDNIKFTSAVIGIEYAYRESQLDLWRTFKTVDVSASGNTTVHYTAASNSTPVPINDFIQLFDTVPFLAGTVEAVDNRFVFGDCLDEQEAAMKPIITNIGVVNWDGVSNSNNWGSSNPDDFTSLSAGDRLEIAYRNDIANWGFKSGGIYKLAIVYQHPSGWISGAYTNDEWRYDIPRANTVREQQNAITFKLPDSFKPPSWAVAFQIVRTNCLNIDYFMFGLTNEFLPLIDNPTQLIDTASLPQSVKDRLRQHFENSRTVNGYELTAEIAKEEAKPSNAALLVRENLFKKDKTVPDFKKLQSYLRKNSLYHKIGPEVRNTQSTTVVADCSRVLININNWYNSSKKNSSGTQNNPMNNLYYSFREGDRVRFVASKNASPSDSQKEIFDVPILEFTGTALIIEKPNGVLWLPKSTSAFVNGLYDFTIEVYSPTIPQEDDYVYYETGEWFPILYPGTSQRDWGKKDWTYTNNAAVTCTTYGDVKVFNKIPFSYGDCHAYNKTNYKNFDGGSTPHILGIRSNYMNPAEEETFAEWERGNGRPNISYSQLPISRFKTTQARFGGKIVEESFINNLNRFQDQDQFIYPSEYGRIRDLVNTANAQVESVGTILLAIGEREAWSIYVNRTTIEDLSGRSQVALSDKVLGSFNTLLGSHGTLNPESVCVERGRVYWWNALDGAWVRYGRDGLTEISFYKMRNWFREIAALLIDEYQTSTPPLVIADFDSYNEELVTFMDHSVLPATFRGYSNYKGSLFSEEDTAWKSIHNYSPERFAKIGTQLYSFKAGSLFKHEQSETHSTFYGVKYDVQWEPVFNTDLSSKKSWQALAYIATDKWSVERILSEYRGVKPKQETSIPIDSFQDREDNLYAAITRDENTPNTVNPRIEGNRMRSKAIQVLMQLNPATTTRSLMHYAVAECEDSPKNP
jgi:hypothetical protein